MALPAGNTSQLSSHFRVFQVLSVIKNHSNCDANTHKNKQNKSFPTIAEIYDPKLKKIQSSVPTIDENCKPLPLQDLQIR